MVRALPARAETGLASAVARPLGEYYYANPKGVIF